MQNDVSIIIPNWNGGTVVGECLESIIRHTHGVDFEIIVIDNGSSDQSPASIRSIAQREPRVRTLFNDENLFFARACNQGYQRSSGRTILVANNDILLHDDAVTALARYADDHPEICAVTPRFVDTSGRPQEFVRRLPNASHVLAHYHPIGRAIDRLILGRRLQNSYFYRERDFRGVEEIEQAGASFSLFQRIALDGVGGLFDERFPLLFNDVDLYRRFKEAGFASHVVPSISVTHLGGVSSRKFASSAYRRLQYDGLFAYFKKHHPGQYLVLCAAWPHWWLRSLRQTTDVVGT